MLTTAEATGTSNYEDHSFHYVCCKGVEDSADGAVVCLHTAPLMLMSVKAGGCESVHIHCVPKKLDP